MPLNTGTYNITPGESQKEIDARRQMAYALWKESMDAPVKHWTQGLANLAKAGIAGNELYQADEGDRQRSKAIADALKNLPGMGDASGEAPGAPTGPAAAPVGPSSGGEPTMDRGITVVPASMRNNNPGAMWPGPSASTYGSTGSQNIAGNNKIASFPDAVSGGAAQFDLLNRKYTGMPLADALRKWSGGNNVDSYVGNVSKATGLSPDTMVTAELLRSPQGIGLAQAMARHEAGRNYPMSPDQWTQAQDRVFNPGVGAPRAPLAPGAGAPPVPPVPMPGAGAALPPAPTVDPAQVPIGTTLPPPDVPPVPPAAAMPPQAPPAAAPPMPPPPMPSSPPTAAVTPQVRSPQLTPAQQSEIKILWADPATRPIAMAKYQEYSKPKDQFVAEKTPEGIHYDRNLLTNERKFAPPQQNISVNSVADPVLKGVGEQLIKSREAANTAASDIIPAIHETRKALDQGAITGMFADPRLLVSKIGNLIGLEGPEASNTEIVASTLGKQVLDHAKALGANPSNADRDYIAKVMGGKISLEEKSIRRLLDMQEKYARQAIKQFNGDAQKLMDGNPGTYKQIAPLMNVTEPDEYKPATEEPGRRKLRYNIQTRQWE